MTGSKISRRYARALLGLGQEDGKYAGYGQNLQEFVEFCTANDEFYRVLSSKIFSLEDRRRILDVVLEKSTFPDLVRNFLRLVLDKNRMGAIQDISHYYTIFMDQITGVTRAEIVTARPIKDEALEKLEKALSRFTGGVVKSDVREDQSLIGGIVVKIGDKVLDGSVKAQLKGLQESLKRGEYN